MKFKDLFEKYNRWPEPMLLVFSLGTLFYFLFHGGTIEWHSLLTVVSVLLVSLIAAVHLLIRNVRKRLAAGIVQFQQEHTPSDALQRLNDLKKDYLYIRLVQIRISGKREVVRMAWQNEGG